MGSYIANFAVYTMAMTGLIFFAVFAYKKFMNGGLCKNNTKFLSIEESMNINPRKSLLVVRAGNEKFLIASDVDRTTLLSKLNTEMPIKNQEYKNSNSEKYTEYIQKNPHKQVINLDVVEQQKEPVHLDIIREKNPKGRHMDLREANQYSKSHPKKTVTLDFEQNSSKGFSTMKEMAKKINEL